MEKVLKYPVPCTQGKHLVALPVGAKILSAKNQNEHLVVYALVELPPTEGHVMHYRDNTFYVATTGQERRNEGHFIDTILFHNGQYVIHIFHLG